MTPRYRTLEDLSHQLKRPGSSLTFLKAFRNEVRQGHIDGAYLPGKFTLPGSTSSGTQRLRQHRNMIYLHTDQVEQWFTNFNASQQRLTVKVTAEAVINGDVNFQDLVQKTRQAMQQRYDHGQTLGRQQARKRARQRTGRRR